MMIANFIVTILLVGYLIYIVKKNNREDIEIQENMVNAFRILDEKVDCILKETDDLLNKLDK